MLPNFHLQHVVHEGRGTNVCLRAKIGVGDSAPINNVGGADVHATPAGDAIRAYAAAVL